MHLYLLLHIYLYFVAQSPDRSRGYASSTPTKQWFSSKESGTVPINQSIYVVGALYMQIQPSLYFTARSVSSIADTNVSQSPSSFIPFSQRQSKSDVAAAAALKTLKAKRKVIRIRHAIPTYAISIIVYSSY